MLWACLHFPLLALETIARGGPGRAPLAVAAGDTRPRIIALNAAAARAGVRPGMAVAGALALAPGLDVHPRRPQAEAQMLREVAQWALQFSPTVSIEGEAALLMEIGAGLKLCGGLEPLLAAISSELPALGISATLAAAPTPSAALMLARAGCPQALADAARLHEHLCPLPVTATGCDEDCEQTLADLGVHTVGELLALPRDGLARRFGRPLLDTLDRALGRMPDPRLPFLVPEQFQARIELPAPAWEVEALLFAFRRLVAGLSGWLRGRGLGAIRLRLDLVHDDCSPSALALNLSTPSRDATHLAALVRERLERTQLPGRVEAIGLATEITAALTAQDRSLFPGPEPAEEAQLLERLCARLGDDAVCALRPQADHRPELAWRTERPATTGHASLLPGSRPPRPLWLLAEPQPLQQFLHGSAPGFPLYDGSARENFPSLDQNAQSIFSPPDRSARGNFPSPNGNARSNFSLPDGSARGSAPIVLMDGPERIESGWWEGRDVRRDYFVARTQETGQTLWIFTEARSGGASGWYVHGIFS